MRSLLLSVLLAGCASQPKAVIVPPAAPLPIAPMNEEAVETQAPPPLPHGYVEMHVAVLVPEGAGAAIALADTRKRVVVPIHVSGTEATSLTHRFEGTRYPRPLTHDLMDSLMHEVGASVLRCQIDKLEEGTFHATLVVKQKGRYLELDARPSDAIALALGARAPILVAHAILEEAGIPFAMFGGPTP